MDDQGLPVQRLLHLPAQFAVHDHSPDRLQGPTAKFAREIVAGQFLGDPVIGTHGVMRRLGPLWLWAWPLWTLVVFGSLIPVRLLPEGYARAAVAVPILLLVPGSLTLGAVFSQRLRPRGIAFICFAALLGAVWSAFASLA